MSDPNLGIRFNRYKTESITPVNGTQSYASFKDGLGTSTQLLGRRHFISVFSATMLSHPWSRMIWAHNRNQVLSNNTPIRTREGEAPPLALNTLDRQIWEEELEEFVPKKIFDAHCHMYQASFDLNHPKDQKEMYPFKTETVWTDCDLKILQQVESVLMPGRQITRLAFPFPFQRCDFQRSNEFIGKEIRSENGSAALMLVEPSMSYQLVEKAIFKHRFLGLKPYHRYCLNQECRITDFLPENQIAVANRYGLLIMLHISMKKSFADPRNINDLLYLTRKYPRAQWILAHGARSFAPFPIEKAAPYFRGIPNIWYEVSAVCTMDSFDVLFSKVPIDKILYGADSGDVGFSRGKIVFYGSSWGDLTPSTNQLGGELTFYVYEQLRAMKRAANRFGLTPKQIQDLFFTTADRLVRATVTRMQKKHPAWS